MKKLILLLVAVILIVGLLSGCDFLDWLFPGKEKLITITWFEDAIRYHPDGTEYGDPWYNDPLGPATLIQDDGGWCFADVQEYYNYLAPDDVEGILFIGETGLLSGYAKYIYNELPTEDSFLGQVEIIVYEDGTSGTMVGTYTQWSYKFGNEEDVTAKYPNAIQCVDDEDKWFVAHADYITYPR